MKKDCAKSSLSFKVKPEGFPKENEVERGAKGLTLKRNSKEDLKEKKKLKKKKKENSISTSFFLSFFSFSLFLLPSDCAKWQKDLSTADGIAKSHL